MPIKQCPCAYVYWQKIENHDKIKQKYMPIISEISKNEGVIKHSFSFCKMKSSIHDKKVNNFLENEDIKEIVWDSIDNMINEVNSQYDYKISPINSILDGYWFNIYETGDFQEQHTHIYTDKINNGETYSSSFSLVYILNDENIENSIVFINGNNGTIRLPYKSSASEYNLNTGEYDDIKEGTVIIFPSTLPHLVKPCIKSGRITLAFNIFSTFKD